MPQAACTITLNISCGSGQLNKFFEAQRDITYIGAGLVLTCMREQHLREPMNNRVKAPLLQIISLASELDRTIEVPVSS